MQILEGSRRHKKVQEGLRRLNKALKSPRIFMDVKGERVPKGLRYIVVSWFGWIVNQEGYGLVALTTDWIVCSLIVGASESDEGLFLIFDSLYQNITTECSVMFCLFTLYLRPPKIMLMGNPTVVRDDGLSNKNYFTIWFSSQFDQLCGKSNFSHITTIWWLGRK